MDKERMCVESCEKGILEKTETKLRHNTETL